MTARCKQRRKPGAVFAAPGFLHNAVRHRPRQRPAAAHPAARVLLRQRPVFSKNCGGASAAGRTARQKMFFICRAGCAFGDWQLCRPPFYRLRLCRPRLCRPRQDYWPQASRTLHGKGPFCAPFPAGPGAASRFICWAGKSTLSARRHPPQGCAAANKKGPSETAAMRIGSGGILLFSGKTAARAARLLRQASTPSSFQIYLTLPVASLASPP